MPEKLDIQFMGRFKCSFTHRQRESGLLILDSSPRRRVWLDYDEPDKRGERLSVLCVLKIAAVRRELAVELQNLDDGMVEIQPSTFTASIAKRRKQRLEFPSGLSGGAADRISQITADIDRIADNVIFNFRWRLGLHGAGRPTSTAGKYLWSKDGKHWSPVPRTTYGDLEFRRDLVVENLDANIVAIGLADERLEPISHVLFRDAWSQRHQDPKASLAQGVSSLEVAVKQCIVRLVPETEYLLLEIQAPPVLNLLSNYLPQLIAGKSLRVPQLPRSVIDDVKAMIHQRNLLVHKGELTIDGERVLEYLWIIHDLLYYLDFATGNKWALSLTSDEFKNWIASEMPELDLTDPLELQTSSKGVKPTD